jgi:hypothetical protein
MARVAVSPSAPPIRLVVRDGDLRRTRLTVFFRLILAIPLFVWVSLRGIAAFVVGFVNWLAVLIQAEVPDSLHDFVASYLRYATQVSAYVFVAADPYPWFRCQDGYPVDLEVAGPVRQGRWGGFFRLFLALPALLLAAVLGGGFLSGGPDFWTIGEENYEAAVVYSVSATGGAAGTAAFLAWFAILARGSEPRGLRDLTVFGFSYAAQAAGYFLLLTPRYPTSDPALAEPWSALPVHPVRITVDDELRRSRLTVLFRLLLAIPHFVWILLWSLVVPFAALAAWVVALATGRIPGGLHRFLAAYIRYATHLYAFVYVAGSKFPGFTGREGSYGIDVVIDGPVRQSRWKTLFRLFLALPASIVTSALAGVLLVAAVFMWWLGLVLGRVPQGLRDLSASCLRYNAQTSAYLLLLTDRYPFAGPVLAARRTFASPPPPRTALLASPPRATPPGPALGAVS